MEPVVEYLRSQDGSFYEEWKHAGDAPPAGGTLLVCTSARWIKDVRTDMDHMPWDHLPR